MSSFNRESMEIKVSIIVPVYNVSKYLRECLDSLICQTLNEIEIILINDGSTDGSAEICLEYAEKDERIMFYNQSNIGLGETRNRGIALAKGQYLSFVDSDDFVDKDFVDALYKKAVLTGADIVETETIYVDSESKEIKQEQSLLHRNSFLINTESIEFFFRNYYFASRYKHYAWDKLYRRDFVLSHHLKFGDNKVIFAEDTWFQLQAIHRHPFVAYTTGGFYRYRQHGASIMHSEKKNLVKRQGRMCRDYYELLALEKEDNRMEFQACNLISLEVLTMEALNQLNIGGNWKAYLNKVCEVKKSRFLISQIAGLHRNRSYVLEPRTGRRMFLYVVGVLYRLKFYTLAHILIWNVYVMKEKR